MCASRCRRRHADPRSHAPLTYAALLPSTFPLGRASVNPSLCPVQSREPTGTAYSPSEPQCPRARTAAERASPKRTFPHSSSSSSANKLPQKKEMRSGGCFVCILTITVISFRIITIVSKLTVHALRKEESCRHSSSIQKAMRY